MKVKNDKGYVPISRQWASEFFMLSDGSVDRAAPGLFYVWFMLCVFADYYGSKRGTVSGFTMKTLAESIGFSETTTRYYIKKLKEQGYIECQHRPYLLIKINDYDFITSAKEG